MGDLPKTPSFRLDGKRALVTGAGRGIGLAASAALAEHGAAVTLVSRTAKEIDSVATAIRARGQKADALALDVTDIEAVRKAVAERGPFELGSEGFWEGDCQAAEGSDHMRVAFVERAGEQ